METMISSSAAALLLAAAFISDIRAMRIPNMLTVSFFAAGCMFHLVCSGLEGVYHSLLGAAAGFLPLLAIYLLKGIGAGDVKLFGALGAWIGAAAVVQVFMYAILYAGAVGAVLLFFNGKFGRRLKAWLYSFFIPAVGRKRESIRELAAEGLRFPFMLAVAPGALTFWLMIGF
ncbi:A24 family peptidase [Paenibacillus nasutitermitis]|uniref:Prepilin type IV endopeptidase peptidase domain-containing protein n=1 Tax=Paenibacillus nasutitermitis TaxID=1652958 RepID=A0A916Z4Q0_9BACL|nr:prepilin peptidase [Paenibacillus nasutitermitis]GGD76676.1 hypothetical protein GCM10010911_38480 [Paenibacillus nasutitermitis]